MLGGGSGGIERVLRAGGASDRNVENLAFLTDDSRDFFAERIRNFANGLKDAEAASKVLEGIAERNRKMAGDQRRAAEDMGLAMLKADVALRNAIKNAEALASGRRSLEI